MPLALQRTPLPLIPLPRSMSCTAAPSGLKGGLFLALRRGGNTAQRGTEDGGERCRASQSHSFKEVAAADGVSKCQPLSGTPDVPFRGLGCVAPCGIVGQRGGVAVDISLIFVIIVGSHPYAER
ncbi:unnamed protein product [Prorocentrum cordatum]|uniref:Uncharacterized protein n=1 Tax=Prorocentrum cordatum TaxID=2364126 RepID=A0ABN9P5Z0_9DINO|nr:unnamed protein product [Polarella glacialis]